MRKLLVLSLLGLSGCATTDNRAWTPEQRAFALQYLQMSQANRQNQIPAPQAYSVPTNPSVHCSGAITGNHFSTSCQ